MGKIEKHQTIGLRYSNSINFQSVWWIKSGDTQHNEEKILLIFCLRVTVNNTVQLANYLHWLSHCDNCALFKESILMKGELI